MFTAASVCRSVVVRVGGVVGWSKSADDAVHTLALALTTTLAMEIVGQWKLNLFVITFPSFKTVISNGAYLPNPRDTKQYSTFLSFSSHSTIPFLLRCMECIRGLAMRILSVRLSNAWIVTKRKKDLSRFLYHKIIWPTFLRRMVGGGDPLYLKFWVHQPPLERNRRFWTDIHS